MSSMASMTSMVCFVAVLGCVEVRWWGVVEDQSGEFGMKIARGIYCGMYT
jgi:hypothetical protein